MQDPAAAALRALVPPERRTGLAALLGWRNPPADLRESPAQVRRAPSPAAADPSRAADECAGPSASHWSTSHDSALPQLDYTEAATWEFCESAGHAFRTYQHVLVKQALSANTLVSLPTGFGKTFVAAVVMRNFLRWFPTGIVVFMAPSRPLVQQQRVACAAVRIDPDRDTVLLTGEVAPWDRRRLWACAGADGCSGGDGPPGGCGSPAARFEGGRGAPGGGGGAGAARLFFCTPQTFENDLREGVVDGRRVVCVVFDEAHHAAGTGYAYAKVRIAGGSGLRPRRERWGMRKGGNPEAVAHVLASGRSVGEPPSRLPLTT